MSDIEKVDEVLQAFIKQMPSLKTSKYLIEKHIKNLKQTIDLSKFENELLESYKQFEDWLIVLLEQEIVQDDIIAFNFGLYESEDRIQLYITGSTEWEFGDEDWASNNNYFPDMRYPDITLYKNLYNILEDNFELGLFLTLSSTIIYANTFLLSQPSKFPQEIILATGFDDGDLYNFFKKSNGNITCLFN